MLQGSRAWAEALRKGVAPAMVLAVVALLTGCGAGNFFQIQTGTSCTPTSFVAAPSSANVGGQGDAFHGNAYSGTAFKVAVASGSQPVSGAAVQLFAAGMSGNGSAGTPLLASLLLTDASGTVAIPASYTCPDASSLLYAISRGGVVGSAPANSNIVLFSALGPCNGLVGGGKAVVDEVTTVAGVYALAQFIGAGGAVGASSTNLSGLTNAFATAATLADPTTGSSPGATLPANVSSPAARVNSISNALSACVAAASSCAGLYAASSAGGAAPSNTLDASLSLARSPAANVAALYTQTQVRAAYAPSLNAAPRDWTLFLTVTGGGMDSPSGLGVDSSGSVWVASYFGVASKFAATGAPSFPNGITGSGLNNSYGLAVDLNDNAWIPNEQPYSGPGTIGSVSVLTPLGASAAGATGYKAGGLNFPLSVAIDPNGTTWVVDYGNSHVTLLDRSGNPLSGPSGYTTPLFTFPVVVALDGNHFGWIGNQSGTTVTKVAPDGSSFQNVKCCDGASGIAIDQGNNVWAANYYGDSVSLINSCGTVVSSGYTGGGSLQRPQGIAVDGAGDVWVANYRQPYLTELSGVHGGPGNPISPAGGYGGDAGLLEAYALALDASGNIWVTNQGSNTLTKFIGMAVPVKTPLSGLPKLP